MDYIIRHVSDHMKFERLNKFPTTSMESIESPIILT